jgi:hypothetical protein
MKVRQLEGISGCEFLASGLRRVKRGLFDGWRKIWWMVGRRYSGWLEKDMKDGWKKVWWTVGRIYCGWLKYYGYDGWLDEGLVDGWKKIWWMTE